MIKFEELNIEQFVLELKQKKFTATEVVKYFLSKIKKDKRNSVLESFDKSALRQAVIIDEKIASGAKVGKLCGVPIIIKDNIFYAGHKSAAASKMLEDFVAPYNATIVDKLLAEDAIIIGRANMDEFAMGTTGSLSAFGKTLNAKSDNHYAGGTSSGSASAAASGLCLAAIGSDTGGSARCPAAWNGVFAIKPTYGTVSRYGITAMASSFDQASPIAKNAKDTALVLSVMRGKSKNDATSIDIKPVKFGKKLRIGYVKQVWEHKKDIQKSERYEKLFENLKNMGHEIVNLDIKNMGTALTAYYVIVPAEVSSNMACFDGLRYGARSKEEKNIEEFYKATRSENFGSEVRRRINIGNLVMKEENINTIYNGARTMRAELKNEFAEAFKKCDFIITPVTPNEASKIGEITDPLQAYLIDLFTIVANMTGCPALAIPFGTGNTGMPLGMQLLGAAHSDDALFAAEKIIQEAMK
ncbi:MAG: aspartyl/glutamyl-tRNA amidotransferase subunit A [Firmicutes bacterium]|nr:aspartyl/glutamyl-tRNA amidotransferase subunit A [Bacillota bacterium]